MANNNKTKNRAAYASNLKPSMLALAVSSCLAFPVLAQDTTNTDDEAAKLERIEVTARRTVENLQTVPVAVTSLGEEQLAQRGIDNITSVQQYSPNTTLQVSRGTNSTLTAYIRGIGQQDPLWGFEPGVGIYIDDVYLARPQGAALDVYDVERVEVLRGPQGTLYGRNTIGGAVKYVTKPLTGDRQLAVRGTLGSYKQHDLRVSGQTGLTDTLFISGAFASFNRDGFGKFINTGDHNYNKDLHSGRLSLQWNLADNFRLNLSTDKTVDNSNPRGGFRLFPSALAPTDTRPTSVYDANISMPVENKVETKGHALTLTWDVSDNWTIKSITAKREGVTDTNIDFDSTSFPTLDIPAFYEDEQTSQELQFLYTGERLKVASGLYYYSGEACGAFGQVVYGLSTTENGGCVDTDSTAFYSQGSYQLDEKWSLTLGGRYTKDDKDASVYRYVYSGYKFPRQTGGTRIGVQTDFTDSASFSHFSPRAGVEYQYSRDLMLYGSYTNGFKSGGFDMRANQAVNPDANKPYTEETVDTFEFGMKSEWLDQRLRLNAAVFMSKYDDMQVTVQRSVELNGAVTVASQVLNAANADINGAEIEATFAATRDLNLSLILGYVDAKFNEVEFFDPNQQQVIDVSNLWSFANTPDLTATLAATYSIAISSGELVFTGNMAHRGATQIFEIPSLLDYGSYTLFNAGVTWYSNDGHWDISFQGKNLGNKEARIAGYNFAGPVLDNSVLGFYIDPRTFSLSVGYRF